MALAGSLVLVGIVSFAVRARRRPVVSGVEGLLREQAEAVESFEREGLVRVHGEVWTAVSRIRQGWRAPAGPRGEWADAGSGTARD